MKVVEKFTSINGEGTRAGELAVFIRFKGCNLRCSYCDTMWANEPDCQYKEETPEEILNYVLETGIRNVTLTGGEPLLQKDIRELINLLYKPVYRSKLRQMAQLIYLHFVKNDRYLQWIISYRQAGAKNI